MSFSELFKIMAKKVTSKSFSRGVRPNRLPLDPTLQKTFYWWLRNVKKRDNYSRNCCWFRGCGWSIMNRRNTFERKKTVRESLFWNVSDTVVRSSETDERLVAPEMTLSLWRCQNKLRSKADHVLILWNRLPIPLWVWSNHRKTSVKNIQQIWKRDGNLIESEKQF